MNFLRTERDESVKTGGETFQRFAGQADDQIRVDVDAGFVAQKIKIICHPLVILPATDERADFGIECLDADLKLQRSGRKFCDDFTQLGGQAVGNHLEMKKHSGLIAR